MNFSVIPFKELLKKVVDNRGKTCPTSEEGIPLIATNCIKNETLYPVYEKVRYISQETYYTWFRGHPEPGDIIFVVKGSPGQCCWVPDPIDFCIAQDMVALRVDEKKVYPKYLFALLRSQAVQAQIVNMHVGTLIPHFKKGDFDKLFLPIPDDLKYQKKVGDAYFTFCEKVELNRQINQTLEAMAQALFKSWFIDFEPVRAKIAALETGEDPTLAAMRTISGKTDDELAHWQTTDPDAYDQLHATASLFPEVLVESELGLVPEGWEVKPLDCIANYLNGLALQKFPPENEDDFLPVIKIAQLNKGDTTNADRASSEIKSEYVVNNGDMLFSWSGSLEIAIWCGGAGALNQHLFKVTSNQYPQWFYYHWTLQYLNKFRAIAAAKAVTMGHIQRKHLTEALCAVPDAVFLSSACLSIRDILDKAIKLKIENQTLANLRDTLLPKLLSGELTVAEALCAV